VGDMDEKTIKLSIGHHLFAFSESGQQN